MTATKPRGRRVEIRDGDVASLMVVQAIAGGCMLRVYDHDEVRIPLIVAALCQHEVRDLAAALLAAADSEP